MSAYDIQKQIDQLSTGGILTLDASRREVEGPVVIRKHVTIEGQGATIWAEKGPVLTVEADGVVLNDLNVEITKDEQKLAGEETYAIVAKPGLQITLDDVRVRGNVVGLAHEEGVWRYPRTLRLGTLKAHKDHEFKIRLIVPVRCSLKSEIAGLAVKPTNIKTGGLTEVTLKLDSLPPGVMLRGDIIIRTGSLTRWIRVNATIPISDSDKAVTGTGQVIWEPDDWGTARVEPPQIKIEDVSLPEKPKRGAKKPKRTREVSGQRTIPREIEREPIKRPPPVVPKSKEWEELGAQDSGATQVKSSKPQRAKRGSSTPSEGIWTQQSGGPGDQPSKAKPTAADSANADSSVAAQKGQRIGIAFSQPSTEGQAAAASSGKSSTSEPSSKRVRMQKTAFSASESDASADESPQDQAQRTPETKEEDSSKSEPKLFVKPKQPKKRKLVQSGSKVGFFGKDVNKK